MSHTYCILILKYIPGLYKSVYYYYIRETRMRQHNFGTTAEQAALAWACVAKRRQ